MTKKIQFEYEWNGLKLLCSATFEGINHRAVSEGSLAGPEEHPSLSELTATISDDSGNEQDFDIYSIYESHALNDVYYDHDCGKWFHRGGHLVSGIIKRSHGKIEKIVCIADDIEDRAYEEFKNQEGK